MALVPVALVGRERLGYGPVPTLVLPPVEPADDRGHVGVAQLLHGLGRERRAGATGAVGDDVARLVRDPTLDGGLERAPGDVEGTGQRALLVLVRLADVEDDGVAAGDLVFGLGRLDLADLGLGLGQHLSERGHVDHDPSYGRRWLLAPGHPASGPPTGAMGALRSETLPARSTFPAARNGRPDPSDARPRRPGSQSRGALPTGGSVRAVEGRWS